VSDEKNFDPKKFRMNFTTNSSHHSFPLVWRFCNTGIAPSSMVVGITFAVVAAAAFYGGIFI